MADQPKGQATRKLAGTNLKDLSENRVSPGRADHALAVRLREVTRALDAAEARATEVRDERNHLLYLAVTNEGYSERGAAALGNVGASYAHRIRTHAGQPTVGPEDGQAATSDIRAAKLNVLRSSEAKSREGHPVPILGFVLIRNKRSLRMLMRGKRTAPLMLPELRNSFRAGRFRRSCPASRRTT